MGITNLILTLKYLLKWIQIHKSSIWTSEFSQPASSCSQCLIQAQISCALTTTTPFLAHFLTTFTLISIFLITVLPCLWVGHSLLVYSVRLIVWTHEQIWVYSSRSRLQSSKAKGLVYLVTKVPVIVFAKPSPHHPPNLGILEPMNLASLRNGSCTFA